MRMAVHYDDAGQPAGFVSYRFAGWDSEPPTMKIVDLVASTPSAYLELWRYLGSLDLVERITWDGARLDDALPWALRDRRCYRVKGTDDVLWVRLLDVAGRTGEALVPGQRLLLCWRWWTSTGSSTAPMC